MSSLHTLVVLLLFITQPIVCRLSKLGFGAPFNAVDGFNGARTITDWTVEGDAQVLQSFVRLTPDRQTKRGSLWSNNVLEMDQFSAIFKFRMSGQVWNSPYTQAKQLTLSIWAMHRQLIILGIPTF